MSLKPFVLVLLTTLICGVGAAFASLSLPKQYESDAKVVIRRSRLAAGEETRNRWVWVRDGLSVTEELLADDFLLEKVIRPQPILKSRLGQDERQGENLSAKSRGFLDGLRGRIKVLYTGGDANGYLISAVDEDPEVARWIVEKIIERLTELFVTDVSRLQEKAIAQITANLTALLDQRGKASAQERELLEIRISSLAKTHETIVASALTHKVEAPELVQVVKIPVAASHPSWPRKGLVTVFGLFGGFCLGLGIEWLRRSR